MATVREILLHATARTGEAQAAIHDLGDEIRRVPHRQESSINVRQIGTNLDKLKKDLQSVDRTKVNAKVNVDISKALVDIDDLFRRLENLSKGGKREIDVQVRRDLNRELLILEQTVVGIGQKLGAVASGGGRSFAATMGEITQQVKAITPVVNGLGLILTTLLVPGLIAAAGAAGGTVTAMGALATSMAGAAIPAAGLLAVVFNRLTKVMDAYRATTDANAEAQRKTIDGTTAAEEAADRRRQAENALRDAIQSRAAAERGLREARRTAGEALDAADRRVATAQQAVGDAARNVEQQFVDAYRAMEDAAERVRDSVLDVQDAQLGQDRAALTYRQARQALRDYLADLGTASDTIDSMFNKFTDVDFDAGTLAGSISGDPRDRLELEDLILRVREAKQGEKHATDDLADSETGLKRAREDNAGFLRKGIAAYQPLADAQRAAADANRELADATKEQTRLQRLGIRDAPQVIAARDAVRDAEERLAEARLRANRAREDSGLTAAQLKARQLTDDLTESEKRYLAAIMAAADAIKTNLGGASDAVIGGMTKVIGAVILLLPALRDEFDRLGDAANDALTRVAGAILGNVDPLQALTDGAADVTEQLGRIGGAGLTAFLNVATAGLPALNEFLGWAADNMERLAGAAKGNRGQLGGDFLDLVEVLKDVIDLGAEVGAALFEAFVVVAPYAEDLVEFLKGGVREFRRFIKSSKGKREIQQFFEDTMPLVKSIVRFVVQLGVTFLRVFQAFSPVIKPTVDLFTDLLKVLDWLIGAFGNIWQPLRTVLGDFLAFGAVGRVFRILRTGVGLAIKVIERFGKNAPRWLHAAWDALGDVAEALKFRNVIPTLTRVGRAIGGRIVGGVRTALNAARGLGARLLNRIRGGVDGAAKVMALIGLTIIAGIAAGARAVWGRIRRVGESVVRWVRNGVVGLWDAVKDIGGDIIGGLIQGITDGAQDVTNAMRDLAGGIVSTVRDVLDINSPSRVMYDLGADTMQGFADGLRSMDLHGIIKERFGAQGMIEVAILTGGGDLEDIIAQRLPGGKFLLGSDFIFDGRDHSEQLFNKRRWTDVHQGDPVSGLLRGGIKLLTGVIHLGERELRKQVVDRFLGLAQGGVIRGGRGGVPALIGEASHDEAVLPLTSAVMRRLATALAAQLRFPNPASPFGPGAALAGVGSGVHIENLNLPPAPGHNQLGDPRVQAVQLARELSRRGGGGPSL